ncbi:MAG TPA: phage tail sheath C-terminal domain-containing protein [Rhodanobacteraceae bacterium]|nr:phage tail sheath C-terminal domain-containing protein [Rhodanobacteraceae bacterium]
MPEYLTPGIYLRPKPEARRDVRLVRTDIAGFVGYAERGPLVEPGMPDAIAKRLPQRVTSWKEFRATFGGFIPNGHLAYGVKAFFENGGRVAYIVRAAATQLSRAYQRPREARWLVPLGVDAPPGRKVTLAGDAGPLVPPPDPTVDAKDMPFRVTLTEKLRIPVGMQIALSSGGVTDVSMIVDASDATLRLAVPLSAEHAAGDKTEAVLYDTGLSFVARSKGAWGNRIRIVITPLEIVTVGDTRRFTDFSLRVTLDPGPDTSAPIEEEYYNRLSTKDASNSPKDLSAAFNVVDRINRFSNLVRVLAPDYPAQAKPPVPVFFFDADVHGVPLYLEGGQDGLSGITARDVTGGTDDLRGLRLLEEVDEIGILCVPDAVFEYQAPTPPADPPADPCRCKPKIAPKPPGPGDATERPAALDPMRIYDAMIVQCERLRDRVALIDTPRTTRGAGALLAWRRRFATRFAALYYPWLEVPDALDALGGTRAVPPCGHVAGVYALTDNTFGVQRPPANAELAFASRVVDDVDRLAQEQLNPYDINAIRSFPGRGIRVWGARALAESSDADWRFIHVRRLMSMIEKSVEKSMQWAVFEPNDFPLRRTLAHALNVFLEQIWRAGGMKGDQPAKGFFVKCDETNNPQSVVDAGQIVCQVGVAVAAPMEFIVFEIRQGGADTELLEQ